MRRFFIALCLLLLLPAGRAEAHAVFVFGFFEGDQVCARGYFAKDRPVMEGDLEVRDQAGKVLVSGRTDASGNWCGPRPAGSGELTLVLNAGEGHQAEFTLAPEKDTPVQPAAPVPPADAPAGETPATGTVPAAQGSSAQTSAPQASAAQVPATAQAQADQAPATLLEPSTALEEMVHRAVRDELLSARLEDANTPGLKDILGGLGWIVALAALGYMYLQRRSK